MWNAKEGLKFAMFMLLLFMTVLSGCSGGTADNAGKGDAVGNGKTKEDENNRKSGGASSGEEVEITVWTWPDNDKTFEITVPIFEELNPDIKVNVQAFPSNQYADKLLATIVSGSGPDVAMVEIGNVAQFKTQNAFEDLSREPYNAGQYANQYASFSWDYVTGEDGYIFALPKNTGPAAMFYRRDLFQAAGLPDRTGCRT